MNRRTLQTAVGIFGGEDQPDRLDVTSWEDSAVEIDETSTTFDRRPPIVAYELCRERMIENEDEILWDPNERETLEAVKLRAIKFLKWLWWEREEEEIAVVSHGVFLQQAMMQLIENSNLPLRGHPLYLDRNNCYEPCSRMMMGLGSESMICKQQYYGRMKEDGAKDKVPVEEVEVST
ncbi:hypothetical protein V6N13_011939 [Hibiscus sabdariffa]|uniref:Phosphoglycerate mutase-like protein n=1 Tax=Hibiscus sabdariffa TaxID=183260 RepID=A0ABR2SDW7_9ROSI